MVVFLSAENEIQVAVLKLFGTVAFLLKKCNTFA